VTREQLIVVGFIAGAFVAGWLVRALTGDRGRDRPGPGGQLGPLDEQLHSALEESWGALERALRAYHATVALALRRPARASSAGSADASSGNASLAEEVAAALRSDAANESMLGAVSVDRDVLSDFELDLADWGFAYGVAWGLARERRPAASDEEIAREAFATAESVFRDYTRGADWTRPVKERLARQAGRVAEESGLPNGAAGGPNVPSTQTAEIE
jgi:hypothetical protein